MNSFVSIGNWQTVLDLGLSSQTTPVSLEEAREHPNYQKAVELYETWAAMPREEGTHLPHFRCIQPRSVGSSILPTVFILDVEEQGKEFRWRLVGSEHANRLGGEITGKRISKVAKYESAAASAYEYAKQVYQTAAPVFFTTLFHNEIENVKETSTVALPMIGDSGKIERIFGCAIWCYPQRSA